ncbi:MAG TPA: hypothetical protein VMT64_12055, partial [Candidatus Binataceae bacterium]|nr:hypothetical protein [Candidatus Binataceae bacterium]
TTTAPGAPAALSTTSALPVLNPAPGIIFSSAPALANAQTVYRCSCFGTGLATEWVGQVQATSFLSADQAASAQCSATVQVPRTQSPYINPPGGISLGRSPFPNANPNIPPGDVVSAPANPVSTEATAASLIFARAGFCSRCACN